MALPMKQTSLIFLLFTCTLGLESVHAFAPKIGSIANAVESIAKLFKAAGKAPVPADKLDDLAKNLPSGARTVIEKLAKASPELRRVATPEFLSFVAKNPEFASDACGSSKKIPVGAMRCASNETLQRVPHVLPESCETHGWIVLRGNCISFGSKH